jgi:hypothetical protein
MNSALLDQIVNAVLYEGYILYPYRPSSKKNRRERFTFGRVYPEAYSRAQSGAEPCRMQTQCLVEANKPAVELEVSVRFLQPMAREIGAFPGPVEGWEETATGPAFQIVPELRVGEQLFQSWHEAVEREVRLTLRASASGEVEPNAKPVQKAFRFAGSKTTEPIRDPQQRIAGVIIRQQPTVAGVVELTTEPLAGSLCKVTVRVLNQTAVPEAELTDSAAILMRTFASTHTILHVRHGQFVSLTAPSAEHKPAAEACQNLGTWPVLVGDEAKQERDTLLSSPIILYDYPKIAPESAGPLFDGTEIDEILTLRILTMSDQEKLEMRQVDEQARRLLERTEALPEDALLKLHGVMRPGATNSAAAPRAPDKTAPIEFDDFFGANTALKGVSVQGVYLQAGDRVRIRPKARADAMDMALAGQTAIIEAVEQDLEHRIHLALVVDADPGKDLGLLRQPGHRFFYGVDEVEPLREQKSR